MKIRLLKRVRVLPQEYKHTPDPEDKPSLTKKEYIPTYMMQQ